jgi:hypothetical protein
MKIKLLREIRSIAKIKFNLITNNWVTAFNDFSRIDYNKDLLDAIDAVYCRSDQFTLWHASKIWKKVGNKREKYNRKINKKIYKEL